MKKIFTLLLSIFALGAVNAYAQTWDFSQGWSDVTKANFMADAATWTLNRGTADAPTGWKNAVAVSGVLKANGQVITELEGLEFTSFPAANLLLDPGSIRWSKKDQGVTIRGVKNGQTITLKGRSANKTAEDRSIISKTAEAKYVSGPADGIIYGGSATSATALAELANAEGGVFTLVWEVETEKEEGVDVTICCGPNGGIDIPLIKVSGGSADEDKNVAWVSTDPNNDMYAAMRPTTGVQYTDIAAASEISTDSLRTFDAVIISADVTADTPMGKLLEENIAFVPMVNLNAGLFGYTPADVAGTILTAVNPSSDLFTDISIAADSTFEYAAVGVALPERFANDDILAKNGDAVAFHQHNAKRNTYILIPADAEGNAAAADAYSPLMANAIAMASATKKAITKVAKPVISQKNNPGETIVTISCATAGSKIQYAIGEGEFQAYTEPFTMTEEGTVYAIASAEGYLPITEEDGMVTADIKVYQPTAAPVISYTQAEGVAYITMTADEGATVYYNFVGSSAEAESVAYTDTIKLSENTTITAFAKKEGYINSDPVNQKIEIEGLKFMDKVLGHFDAKASDWRVNQDSPNSSKAFYYCSLKDGSSKKYNLSEDYTVTYTPEGNDWTIKTSGQQVVWETTGPQKKVGDTSNYNPVSITDLIGNEITNGEITFGATGSHEETLKDSEGNDSIVTVSDKPSAELVSNVKFQAPFNIITYIGAKPGKIGFEYFVSTDGEKWDSIAVSPVAPTYDDAASKWRLWHRDVISYNGTDEVYLKVKSISTDTYRIFDIFVKGESENTAIKDIATEASEKTSIRKVIENGKIVILNSGIKYNVAGQRVK